MKIGIIGAGERAAAMCHAFRSLDMGVQIACIADPNPERSKVLLAQNEFNADEIKFYPDADSMLDNETPDGVMVGTSCSIHTEMGIKVMERNLPLFLEKPVSTTESDLERLKNASKNYKNQAVVSFPLRLTAIAQRVKEIIDSGLIGKVEHVQAVNNVNYGTVYYKNWYRDENETGGLWLQKATHDIDYINYLLGYEPVSVCAVSSKQIFKGNKTAGLKCAECDERSSCTESDINVRSKRHDTVNGDYCCFAEDTGNEDSGSLIITYDTGMHAVYSQNFFVRHDAGKRGARLIGYDGTIEFDWKTDTLTVYMHNQPRTETVKFNTFAMSHGGGDTELARNFINVIKGVEDSKSTLTDGIKSAAICLAAKRSAKTGTFQNIVKF